ncbi:MAG TPA: HAMP domain-containing protein, partial [Polyangiales bacterium]|nr:HAMP domain-containing protein [Polyangiales bacterium]
MIAPIQAYPLRSKSVAAVRKARAGISISVKLLVATSVLVAAAVGTATVFTQRALSEITESQIKERRDEGHAAIARESELVVQAVATAVALPLANHVYADIQSVLDAAISEDRSSRVQWLVIQDKDGMVASTEGTPDQRELDRLHRLLADGKHQNDVVRARIGETEWVFGADIKLGRTMLGKLRIGVSTAGLERELITSLAEAERVAHGSRTGALLGSLIVLALGVAFAALQGIQLAKPIRALTETAERIATGDLDHRVAEGRRDELGV